MLLINVKLGEHYSEFSGVEFSYNFKVASKIASLFAALYPGYELRTGKFTFDDSSFIVVPLVRIKARTIILESLPFSFHTELHCSSYESLMEKIDLIKLHLNAHYLAFSFSVPIHGHLEDALRGANFREDFKETDVLSFAGRTFDELFEKQFTGITRNQCRRSLKSDMIVEKSRLQNDLEAYYKLYQKVSQKWGKDTLLYPLDFFKGLLEEKLQFADLWVARMGEKVIAGIVVILYENWVLYFSGAMDRSYSSDAPMNGLLYSAIKHYVGLGKYAYMDFGPSVGLSGVRKFKKGFGTTVSKYSSYTFESKSYKYLYKPMAILRSQF